MLNIPVEQRLMKGQYLGAKYSSAQIPGCLTNISSRLLWVTLNLFHAHTQRIDSELYNTSTSQ